MSVIVQTKYNKEFIVNEIICDDNNWDPTLFAWVTRRIIYLQEKGIKEALIKLGWTPPKEE